MSLPIELARLSRRVADLERRLENTVRHGTVRQVDPATQRARFAIGKGPDGTEQLSPWLPYAQQAGALKIHTPVSEGQNMTLFSPGGNIEQGVAIPMTWNDGNASPGSSADENVLTFGNVEIRVTESSASFTVGGHTVTISAAGTDFDGGHVRSNGTHIDDHHIHTGVESGGSTSGPPV